MAEGKRIISPVVIWITGLSGAGETTIGHAVFCELFARYPNTVFLDGDAMRVIVGDELGHTKAERLTNAFRMSRMCQYLVNQGHNVVCSTMSLFPEIWDWNRKNIAGYVEIYLRASNEALVARDTKGVYAALSDGRTSNVIGWDLPFDEPSADLVINTDSSDSQAIRNHVSTIIHYLSLRETAHGAASL